MVQCNVTMCRGAFFESQKLINPALVDNSESNHGVVVVTSVRNPFCGHPFDSARCIPFFLSSKDFFSTCADAQVQLFIPKLIPNFLFQSSYVQPHGLAYVKTSSFVLCFLKFEPLRTDH